MPDAWNASFPTIAKQEVPELLVAAPWHYCLAATPFDCAFFWVSRKMHDEEWKKDNRDLAEMLLAGDAMLGFVHELNNILNSMMLQASVVELKAGESIRPEVALIRKLGAQAARSLAFFSRLRERYRLMKESVELNDTVRAVLANERLVFSPSIENRVQPELNSERLTILAHPVSLKQLILVLLQIAGTWHPEGLLRVRTTRVKGQIWLVIEPNSSKGTEIADNPWTDLAIEEDNFLQLLAAQSRARLVEAELQMAVIDAGNRALAAIWPAEAPPSSQIA